MAYRFDGVDDLVEFAITPFTGYVFGPQTWAVFVKRGGLATTQPLLFLGDSAAVSRTAFRFIASNVAQLVGATGSNSGATFTSTSLWYLIVVTKANGTATARFHVHDGTSWAHSTGGGTVANLTAILASNRLFASSPAAFLNGDLVCAGIKKADSSDAAVETLSRTSFQAWRDFGFDWLIGFDSSLETGGVLQDQGSAGTGDEIAITGTTLVSDPPGWAWSSLVAPVANFTGTPLSGELPLNVAFTDTSA